MKNSAPSPDATVRRLFFVCALGCLAYMGIRIFSPFLSALLAAAAAAHVLAPFHRRVLACIPGWPTTAAIGITLAVFLLLAVPFFIGTWTILSQAAEAYPTIRASIDLVARSGASALPPQLTRLHDVTFGVIESMSLNPQALIFDNLDKASTWAGSLAKMMVGNAILVAINLAVFVAALFFFLRDGADLIRRVVAAVPLAEEERTHLVSRVSDVLRAVVNGMFFVALLQGGLAWIGFVAFQIPFAALLGALCFAFSPIPLIGTGLVWAPVVAYIALYGAVGKAAGLAAWFILAVGMSDNVLRPILLGSQMKLPVPLVFVSVIGGLKAFGFPGLFLGPLMIALSLALLDILRKQDRP